LAVVGGFSISMTVPHPGACKRPFVHARQARILNIDAFYDLLLTHRDE
jgi:hypothetical protein